MVVDSKTKLKSLMRQEQRQQNLLRQEEGGVHHSTSATDQQTVTVDPWQHLFLPLGGSTHQDEFTSATQTQTPTGTPQILSQSDPLLHQDGSAPDYGFSTAESVVKEEFQPELWSRIQIRYAPTVHHVQSLFRCLHLSSETTSGITFGSDHVQAYHPAIEAPSMPTLVMLIGCFGDRNIGDEVPGMDPSSLCVLPNHLPYTGGNGNTSVDGPSIAMTTSKTTVDATPTPLQALATRRTAEDQERLEYIRAVSQAMSEIKDSLDWIERAS